MSRGSEMQVDEARVAATVLNAKISGVLIKHDVSHGDWQRATTGFSRLHIVTMRDVLVLGRERIAQIHHIGDVTLRAVTDSVQAELGDTYDWQDKPPIKEIEPLCDDLDHLPGSLTVARTAVNGLKYYRSPKLAVAASMSIDSLLKTNPDKLADRMRIEEIRRGHEVIEAPQTSHILAAAQLKAEADLIAGEFLVARDVRLGNRV